MAEGITLDTLKAELGHLELRIVDRITAAFNSKADRSHVEALEKEIESIKVHGSPAVIQVQQTMLNHSKELSEIKQEQAAREHYFPIVERVREDVGVLQQWRTRLAVIGGLAVLVTPFATSAAIHYLP